MAGYLKHVVAVCLIWTMLSALAVAAPTRADKNHVAVKMPTGNYRQHLSDQGVVSRSPDGKYIVFWENDVLHRFPSPGRSIELGMRDIDWVRWNREGTKLLIGSARGGETGWAWEIDSRRFRVVRKLAGNIAAAWFEGSHVAIIEATKKGAVCVRGRSRRRLPRSLVVSASTEDGAFLLARTHLHIERGYRGNLVIFRNARNGLRLFATVQRNVEFTDEPSELLVSNRTADFLVTVCGNPAYVTALCAAYFVGAKERRSVKLRGSLQEYLFFDLNAYWSPSGFCGVCRTVDDQHGDVLRYTEYQYTCDKGKLSLHKLPDPMIAYAVDRNGQEVSLRERLGTVFLETYAPAPARKR